MNKQNKIHHIDKRSADPDKIITLANGITLSRIIFTVIMIFCMKKAYYYEAYLFFIAAGITDFFDGFAARVRNEQSLLGSYLDPLADKFLVLSALFLVQSNNDMSHSIPTWFFIIMLIRELVLVFGGMILYCIYGKSAIIAPTATSKMNTILLLILIAVIFGSHLLNRHDPNVLSFFLILNALLALISTLQYAIISIRKIQIETY